MDLPFKYVMARKIARKLVDNPQLFPELVRTARLFHESDYWETGHDVRDKLSRWEQDAGYWRPIRERLPEILEKLRELDDPTR